MVDQFMGQCVVDAKERSDPDNPFGDEAARVERTLDLYNKGSKKDEKLSGSIKILIGKMINLLYSVTNSDFSETHKDLTAL